MNGMRKKIPFVLSEVAQEERLTAGHDARVAWGDVAVVGDDHIAFQSADVRGVGQRVARSFAAIARDEDYARPSSAGYRRQQARRLDGGVSRRLEGAAQAEERRAPRGAEGGSRRDRGSGSRRGSEHRRVSFRRTGRTAPVPRTSRGIAGRRAEGAAGSGRREPRRGPERWGPPVARPVEEEGGGRGEGRGPDRWASRLPRGGSPYGRTSRKSADPRRWACRTWGRGLARGYWSAGLALARCLFPERSPASEPLVRGRSGHRVRPGA